MCFVTQSLNTKYLRLTYQILFDIDCGTLLKFFEMIKSFTPMKNIWLYLYIVNKIVCDVDHNLIMMLNPSFKLFFCCT
jgi:hypothetical protein